MNAEQYEDRKRYIDAVKSSFSDVGRQTPQAERSGDRYRPEEASRSFFGIRFVLALCLLLGFFAVKQTGLSWKNWNADKIAEQIQSNLDVSTILKQFREDIP